MITKVLVANRGEIARRVFRTCHDMGIATVAIYSDPDTDAPFVHEADEAVPLGGATPADSYLRIDRVLAAAERVGADAIHPGYGFLSENAEFARACEDAGITFIGPAAAAIAAMGSKLTAREMMERAGVPVLPGRDLTDVDEDKVLGIADDIGWPVLVKASYGGGGRGMRVVRDRRELVGAIASARREAAAAFGDDTVFLERYVDEPRHIEIQIFGDRHGTVVHLNERECSIQRRHQKIIEESPSPAVEESLRARMGAAAVDAGQALGYVGAGTVEFIVAPSGEFYFLEVNTRLQVEHPVTEMVTGLDLVRLQLEIAAGAPLPPEAHHPPIRGHAIEARLYAEDPARDFLPAAGVLERFDIPEGTGLRVDGGVVSGNSLSTNYDPMLAKVIGYGHTREEAIARLVRALRRARVHGVTTNRALLVGILEDPEFAAGRIDTHFLDRRQPHSLIEVADPAVVRAAALAAALADQANDRAASRVLPHVTSGFRSVPSQLQTRSYRHGERELTIGYKLGRRPRFEVDGNPVNVVFHDGTAATVDLVVDGVRRTFELHRCGATVYACWSGGTVELDALPRFPDAADHLQEGSLVAPMPGTVIRVAVAPGEQVTAGQPLIVLEAMKMEHTVTAPAEATVTSIPVATGTVVDTGTVLIVLDDTTAGDDNE